MSDSVARIKSRENKKGKRRKFIIYIGLNLGAVESQRMLGPELLDAELEICLRGTEVASVMRRAPTLWETSRAIFDRTKQSSSLFIDSEFRNQSSSEIIPVILNSSARQDFRDGDRIASDIVKNNPHISYFIRSVPDMQY